MKRFGTTRTAIGLVGLAAAVVVSVAAGSSHAAAVSHMSPAVGNVRPEVSAPQTPLAGSTDLFDCQSEPIDSQDRCYAPQQLQQAYGFSSLLARHVDGRGQTIVIVDAFQNPYIQQDLSIEDSTFGLPAPPSLTVVNNAPAFDETDFEQLNWAVEISLDVLSAHAMAPGAKIVLIEAASSSDADLFAAEKYAVDHHLGDVMSQSFGENEGCVDPSVSKKWEDLFKKASDQGWTFFASTGDSGAAQFNCDGSAAVLAPGWPAVDPNVTAVGGTTLNADDPAGNYIGETAWTEPAYGCNPPALDYPNDINCSGGGFSTLFKQPDWQTSLVQKNGPKGHPPMRAVPDVSYNAGVNGGILIHSGVILEAFFGLDPSTPAFFAIGGTSAGSPQWAALAAEADQLSKKDLGAINDNLYKLAQKGGPKGYGTYFNDVTQGNNDVSEIGGAGYNAGNGWDAVTGLGTPRAQNLVPALASP